MEYIGVYTCSTDCNGRHEHILESRVQQVPRGSARDIASVRRPFRVISSYRLPRC